MAEYSGRDKRLAYLFDAVENVQVDDMTGASASTDGAHGLVPAPLAGDENKYLKGDGTWAAVQAGAGALSGLSDVDLTTPTDGQALVYDGANSKWVNGNVSGGGNTLVIQDASIYSTDEQQVGVWIDGKPLYQKTLIFQNITFGRVDNLPHNIANVDEIMILDWRLHQSTGNNLVGFENTQQNWWYSIFTINRTTLSYRMGNGWGAGDLVVNVRYTKTTDAAGSGGYKAYGLSPIIYSEEEREVGVWTDGKPLYKRTFVLSSVIQVSGNGTILPNDVQAALVDVDIMVRGECARDTSYSAYISPYFYKSNGDWYVLSADSWGQVKFITLFYTKTTDTAGSGTWTTTGEYAHHYSTAEQVIGTWTDGKPLYECTWELSSAKTIGQSWASLGIILTNGKLIVDGDVIRVDNHGKYPAAFNLNTSTGAVSASTWINNLLLDVGSTITLRYTKTTD